MLAVEAVMPDCIDFPGDRSKLEQAYPDGLRLLSACRLENEYR
jgi:hypothetical protein